MNDCRPLLAGSILAFLVQIFLIVTFTLNLILIIKGFVKYHSTSQNGKQISGRNLSIKIKKHQENENETNTKNINSDEKFHISQNMVTAGKSERGNNNQEEKKRKIHKKRSPKRHQDNESPMNKIEEKLEKVNLGNPICPYCEQQIKEAEKVAKLPCQHVYHFECEFTSQIKRCEECKKDYSKSQIELLINTINL